MPLALLGVRHPHRAIVVRPRQHAGADVLAIFRRLADEGTTIVLVTHDAHVAAAAARAVRLADGWIPFGLSTTEIEAMLAKEDLPPGFEVVLSTGRAVDAIADADRTVKRLIALRDVGATTITCSVSADSPDHYCDQLAALRDLADEL